MNMSTLSKMGLNSGNELQLATKTLLVTANVGSIFENLDLMLDSWLNEFTGKVNEFHPEFIALHMQEVGGKNYKQTMQSIDIFFKKLLGNTIIKAYNRYLILIDSDFTDDMTFTSLSNIYLIHQSLSENDIELYNFNDKSFFKFQSRQIFSGNLKYHNFLHKERFEKSLFKEFQWSRKGFLQTKWRIKKCCLNLVNVHLFHDASNLIALTSSPSIYSENRKKALIYTLDRIKKNQSNQETEQNIVIFGDFNFRLDLSSLVDSYTFKPKSSEFKDENNKLFKVVCNDSQNKQIFTIEEKKFKWHKDSSIKDEKFNLLKFDKELYMNENELKELKIAFPPSYPFEEDLKNYENYMESRCPAWCDRIIMSKSMSEVVSNGHKYIYDMMGQQACMGDHKPIFLFFNVYNKNKTEMSTSNEPVNDLNYVYINNNLANLDKFSTDVHDNAWFQNINLLNYSKSFPTYCDFVINNLNVPIKNRQRLNKSSEFSVKYKQDLVLNQWLQSIAELIILKNKHEISSRNKKECNYKTDCDCVIKHVNASDSNLLKFFANSLNSNFFKLKHLIFYLDEIINYLKKDLEKNQLLVSDINNNKNDCIQFNNEDLIQPFEVSVKSLVILNEIRSFLNTPCSLSLFKLMIQRNFSSKKLSILANIFHS